MSDYLETNRSRRELLRGLAALAGSGLVAGTGCHQNTVSEKQPKSLSLYGTGTLNIKDKWNQLTRDLGIKLEFKDNENDVGPVLTKMISQNAAMDFDLGALQGGAEAELAKAGKIRPWDLDKIPNYKTVWPWAQDIPWAKWEQKQYGLPMVVNADSIIYLPDKTGVVDSYAMVFDRHFKGRASMEDAWINSVIFTAIYLKESGLQKIIDPGDLTESELEGVMGFLTKHKRDGQFLKFWSGWQDGLDLIRNGDVWIMTGWEPIVYAARGYGVKAEYAVPKEGYEGWSNNLLLHIGAGSRGNIETAHQFANWELGGFYGCQLATQSGYIVPNDIAISYAQTHPEFDKRHIEETITKVENKFKNMKGNVYWQNVRPKNYRLYEDKWSELRAA